jgi:putative oxidoreductase
MSDWGKYPISQGAGPFFGRLLISLIFILAGIGKAADFPAAVATLQHLGIPAPETIIIISILFELIGGTLVLLGWYTHIGIYLLMIFLFPVTLIIHAFWRYQGAEMALQLSNFLKNVTIYGGLLLLLSYGPGRWSLDACQDACQRKKE